LSTRVNLIRITYICYVDTPRTRPPTLQTRNHWHQYASEADPHAPQTLSQSSTGMSTHTVTKQTLTQMASCRMSNNPIQVRPPLTVGVLNRHKEFADRQAVGQEDRQPASVNGLSRSAG